MKIEESEKAGSRAFTFSPQNILPSFISSVMQDALSKACVILTHQNKVRVDRLPGVGLTLTISS